MKVIDLLNKIANGEEVPKMIKWGCHYLKWIVYDYKVVNELEAPAFFELTKGITKNLLNDEVEIIEEEKEIPEKLNDILHIDDLESPVTYNEMKIWDQIIKEHNKINEIIDHLKKDDTK